MRLLVFLGVATLYALVASLALYWTFLSTKERISIKPDPNFSPFDDIGSLLRSVPFLTVIAVSVFVGIFVHIKSGLTVFYLKYVIQVPTLDKYFMAGGIISCLVGVCFVSLFLGKVDKKNLFISFMSGNALFVAAIYWVSPTNITLLLIFHFMNSFLGGACAPIFFAIYSDLIDYLELKTGFRSAALINSLGLFAGTLGAAIGGFLAPIGLVWIGYIANAHQNESTIAGLSFLFTIAPAVFAGIAALLMAFYPLSKKRMVLISYRLSKRRIYTNLL
jgi:GPH family glycoside/pentoside/hexuronide:cation symporter